jgi:hypothetical protein
VSEFSVGGRRVLNIPAEGCMAQVKRPSGTAPFEATATTVQQWTGLSRRLTHISRQSSAVDSSPKTLLWVDIGSNDDVHG